MNSSGSNQQELFYHACKYGNVIEMTHCLTDFHLHLWDPSFIRQSLQYTAQSGSISALKFIIENAGQFWKEDFL